MKTATRIVSAAIGLALSPWASAQVSVGITDQTLDRAATTTGSFFVTVTSGSAPGIDGYDFEFSVTPGLGTTGALELIGAINPATSPLFSDGLPVFSAADGLFPAYSGDSSASPADANVGTNLVEILYSVSSDALGRFRIDFIGDIDGLFSSGINQLDNSSGATINVVIPEPTSICTLTAGILLMSIHRRER